MRRKNLLFCCFVVLFLVFQEPVYAAINYDEGTCYHFNKTTGAYASSGGRDCVKKFDDKYVYCVQWKNAFGTGSKYEVVSSWKKNSATAIKAGLIIDLIYDNEKDLSAVKKYALTAATLNTYNSKLSSTWQPSKSYDFYSKNANVKKYYDKAMDYYDKYVKLSTSLNTPVFNASTTLLDYSSNNYFFSNKVTLSGLLANYGNASDKVTYKLMASISSADANDKAYICTGAGGGGTCQESVTISGSASDYSFYVKATGVEANDVIAIKVDGSNSSSYPTTIRYKYSNSTQKVLQKSSVSVSRSTTKTINFVVPDLSRHSISALKVDENGARLSGATLELYKDNVNSSANLLASSTNGQVSYVSPTMATDDDDFFNHSYYLVEKKALDGYVLNTTVKDIYKAGTDINKNTDICYYTDENGTTTVATDAKHCNFSDYEYRCLSSTGELKDLSENGNCNFEASGNDQGSEVSTIDENTNAGDDTLENGSNDDGNTIPSEPEITYEQICYSVSGKSQVDTSYCEDKGKYTNVKKIGGNITITQPNIKNNIKISKRAMTGENEVSGATLKICTSADYESNKEKCAPTKTIDDVEMSWTSGSTPTEFFGIKKGSYYIVEITPPSGYIVTTIATPFSIDEYGVVKSGEKEVKDNLIVVNNQLNHMSISKQDIATSAELPGAKISICYSYEDEDGNIKMVTDQYDNECIPVTLADGTLATWESTTESKKITGLPSGTYFLVEVIAPDGYSTAESILFTMSEDGKLTDEDGNSLLDNKIVMYDKKIEEVKTGMLMLYIVLGILITVVSVGGGTYYYSNRKNGKVELLNGKIRKRKIRKNGL